jgi:hypothetical protein
MACGICDTPCRGTKRACNQVLVTNNGVAKTNVRNDNNGLISAFKQDLTGLAF